MYSFTLILFLTSINNIFDNKCSHPFIICADPTALMPVWLSSYLYLRLLYRIFELYPVFGLLSYSDTDRSKLRWGSILLTLRKYFVAVGESHFIKLIFYHLYPRLPPKHLRLGLLSLKALLSIAQILAVDSRVLHNNLVSSWTDGLNCQVEELEKCRSELKTKECLP